MPAANRNLKAVEQPAEEVPPTNPYNLEPLTDDVRSKLNVWGNATKMAVIQIRPDAPEWARMLQELFDMVGGIIEGES